MDAVTQGPRRNGRRASKAGKTLQISDGVEIMDYVTRATAPMGGTLDLRGGCSHAVGDV